MPAYGKVKVDTITYDLSGTATDVSVANIATKASPTFTGTVTVPTPSADDNSTKAASTAYVQTELGDYALKAGPTFTGTVNAADLVLSGDLTVNGTTTTIDTTTLQVEDKNIEIGKVSTPSDVTADGGGWTLKGATDKTFNWVNATDAWTSSEHIHLLDSKKALLGTDSDLQVYHSGSHGYITEGTGNLKISVADDNDVVQILKGSSENIAQFTAHGSCELYHDNSKKLETTSGGVTVTGTLAATAVTGDGSGLTNLPPGGNTVDLVADGAIAAGKPVIIKSNGKVEQVQESGTPRSTVVALGEIASVDTDTNLKEVQSLWMEQHRMLTVFWTNSANNLYARTYKFAATTWAVTTGSTQTLASNDCRSIQVSYDEQQDRVMVACVVVRSSNYHLEAMVGTPSTSNTNIGSWTNFVDNRIVTGSGNTAESLALFYETTSQKHVFIYRKNPSSGAPGANWDTYSRVISLSGDTFTINSETTLDSDDMTEVDICRVDSSKIAVSMKDSASASGTGWARIGTIGSTTMTWGSRVDFSGSGSSVVSNDPERATSIVYDVANSKLFIGWIHASNKRAYSVVGSVSGTTLSMDTSSWLDISGGVNGNSESWMRLVRDPFGGGIYTYWTHGGESDRVYAAKVTYDSSAGAKSTRGSSTELHGSITNQNSNKNISAVGEGFIYLVANDTSNTDHFDIYYNTVGNSVTNLSASNQNFLGFAEDAISDGNSGTIKLPGNVVGNQSGLTPGSRYYVKDDGDVAGGGTASSAGGLAVASDKLLIGWVPKS